MLNKRKKNNTQKIRDGIRKNKDSKKRERIEAAKRELLGKKDDFFTVFASAAAFTASTLYATSSIFVSGSVVFDAPDDMYEQGVSVTPSPPKPPEIPDWLMEKAKKWKK